MPDLLVASSSANAELADAARDPQSTHDPVSLNAAAQLFQMLRKKYLSSTVSRNSKRTSRLHHLFSTGLDACSEQIVDHAIDSFFEQSKLNPSVIRFLKGTLASGIPLSQKEDRVVFIREEHGVEIGTELYLPLREVFACVWLAINDLSVEAWPLIREMTPEEMLTERLNDLNQTITEMSKVRPELCPPGKRNAWLQAVDGFMGKRLPLNQDDLLYMKLHEFIVTLFKDELHIDLPSDKDPKGEARVLFAQQFNILFLPWLLDNKMPVEVTAAFLRRGGSAALEEYLLAAFQEIGLVPDKKMRARITAFSTVTSFNRTPPDLIPFLATVQQWLAMHASFRFNSLHRTPRQTIVLQVIEWLKSGLTVNEVAGTPDGIQIFYLINRMFEVFDKLKDARLLQVMASTEKSALIQNYAKACDFFQRLSNCGYISFDPNDLRVLKQHLVSFNKGYVLSQTASYQDVISTFFTNWFDSDLAEDEYSYEDYSVRAGLFLMCEEIYTREVNVLNGASSSSQKAGFVIYMTDELLHELFTTNLTLSDYQINRLFLHALWFEPKYWTPLFAARLSEVLIYINSQYSGTNAHKYPDILLKQLERLNARYEFYSSGRLDEAKSCQFASDDLEGWPVLTSTLINSDESFRLIKYLCALPNVSDTQIARLLDTAIGFNPHVSSHSETSLLAYASEKGKKYIVQRLLALDGNPDVMDIFGETPLAHASRLGFPRVVAQLLKQGSNATLSGEGRSAPLHRAAQTGNLETAELLLNNGANVNALGPLGVAPLHEAARNGHLALVNLLINRGAEVNISANNGLKPIHFAVLHKHNEIINQLLNAGAFIDDCTKLNLFKCNPELGSNKAVIGALIDYNINLYKIGLYDDEHVLAARIASKIIASLLLAGDNSPRQIIITPDETELIRRGTLRILRIKYPVIDSLIPEHQYLRIQQGIFRAPRQPSIAQQLTEPFELSEVCNFL